VGEILLSINPLFIFVRIWYFVARLGAGLFFFVLFSIFIFYTLFCRLGNFWFVFGEGGRGLWP
jgi:hypothetical protein